MDEFFQLGAYLIAICFLTGIGNHDSPIYNFAFPKQEKDRVSLVLETTVIPYLACFSLLLVFKDGTLLLPLGGFAVYQFGRFAARTEYRCS